MIACRIHHVAYVESRKPRSGSNLSAALISPMLPSWMRSCSVRPWFMYFLAIETTSRRLADMISCFASCMHFSSFRYSAPPPASPMCSANSSSVTSRSMRASISSRSACHSSICWMRRASAVTSSGVSSRCVPMLLRYHFTGSSTAAPLCVLKRSGVVGSRGKAAFGGVSGGALRGLRLIIRSDGSRTEAAAAPCTTAHHGPCCSTACCSAVCAWVPTPQVSKPARERCVKALTGPAR